MGDVPKRRAAQPFARWSADTERAFLLALKLTGQATKACAEIGRGTSAAYHRRQRDPDFARAWDKAVAEGQAEWAAQCSGREGGFGEDGAGGGLSRWRGRADGWNAARRGAFLRTLARTKNVRAASRAAGISNNSAYYRRGRDPAFAADWEAALAADMPSVADAAYARAVTGWTEPIVAGGKVIGERRRYSDTLLCMMLRHEQVMAEAEAAAAKDPETLIARAHAAAKAAGGGFHARASEAETNAALMKKLDAIERRRRAEEAEAAENARRIGGAPAPRALPGVRKP